MKATQQRIGAGGVRRRSVASHLGDKVRPPVEDRAPDASFKRPFKPRASILSRSLRMLRAVVCIIAEAPITEAPTSTALFTKSSASTSFPRS